MRVSSMFAPTLREVPAEAEIASHQLMLRAGMIRKVASGVYSYLPLAWKTMKKIENIIREETDREGGQEVRLPAVQPAEWWQESGRWDVYGGELWRIRDRHNREFCLGPTHEEVMTATFRGDVRSYKQLPLNLYQIQTKYRDETRPRFGLMRSREFIMQDSYSFDRDNAGLDISYQKMYGAYSRIFTRCGLDFRPVEADTGAIGGNGSHEFMALAEAGESQILYCSSCDYAATDEICSVPAKECEAEEFLPMEKVATPNAKTVEEVAEYLGVPTSKVVKSMVYKVGEEFVVVLIRGDRQVNDVKLQKVLDVLELVAASESELEQIGGVAGFFGPVGLENVRIIADSEVPMMYNYVVGANEAGYHLKNVNFKRGDFKITEVCDIRTVVPGDCCPHCGHELLGARGIEVGQVFKLYDKYSKALGATYTDEAGNAIPAVMGCYGIGVGRTMAAIVEQSHDDDGIIWPMTVAPYHVVVIPVNDKDENIVNAAESIYNGLLNNRVEVAIDDRKERPGVKFKDADLIGYPIRVTIGAKSLERGVVEVKIRKTGESLEIPVDEVVETLTKRVFAEIL